jgi:nitrate/TMAO reductase-like tetraheme cytochrome c subunit
VTKTFIRRGLAGGALTLLVVGISLTLLAAGGIVAWEYSNSNAFCTNACHAVHPEEPVAHALSSHARVHCVECHIGRVPTLRAMALKTEHIHELWGVMFGYERPVTAKTLKPARIACETCHWPAVAHDDTLRVKKHYDADATSTETTIRLTMRTGFGAIRDSDAKGIHWHIEHPVQYAALDLQKQEIPWVQVTYPDGRTETYTDASVKLAPAELDKLPRRTMDCIDCHKSVGHPFPKPEDAVDAAIFRSQLRKKVPDLKARVMVVMEELAALDEKGEVGQETIHGLVDEAASRYRREVGASAPASETPQFKRVLTDILTRSVFAAPGVTWQTFPNNAAHKDSPGCFRCHDGKHLNEKGQAIRLQCNLCHNLPEVQKEGGPAPVASTIAPGLSQPPTHLEPNFMHDHRFRLDASCSGCHGKVEFGREGGSFCANPACHGRKWPQVNLNFATR